MDLPFEIILEYLPLIILALVAFQVLRRIWPQLRRGLVQVNPRTDPPVKTRAQIQEQLQDRLNFSTEELETNRTFQQASLQQRLRLVPSILINLGAPMIGGLLLYEIFGDNFSNEQQPGILQFFSENLIFLIILAAVLVPMLYRAGVGAAELAMGRVESVEGPVSKQTRNAGRRQNYLIVVDGVACEVDRSAFDAVPEGHRYRAYYFPYSKKLASLDLIQYDPQQPDNIQRLLQDASQGPNQL